MNIWECTLDIGGKPFVSMGALRWFCNFQPYGCELLNFE